MVLRIYVVDKIRRPTNLRMKDELFLEFKEARVRGNYMSVNLGGIFWMEQFRSGKIVIGSDVEIFRVCEFEIRIRTQHSK